MEAAGPMAAAATAKAVEIPLRSAGHSDLGKRPPPDRAVHARSPGWYPNTSAEGGSPGCFELLRVTVDPLPA